MKLSGWVLLSATILSNGAWAETGLAPMAPVASPSAVAPAAVPSLATAVAALKRGDARKAVELYKPLVNAVDNVQRAQARYGLAWALDQAGDDVQAVRVLDGTVADASELGQHIAELRARLLLQLAAREVTGGNPVAAQDWLGQYARLTAQPDHERYLRLSARATGAGGDTPPLKVGVLLPLSGPLGATGQEILRGLQLGLQAMPRAMAEGLVLEPHDTAAYGNGGAGAAAQAALSAGAAVIAGPLLGSDVEAVVSATAATGAPVIAFTTDRTALTEGVHSIGYLPTGQARAVADWAAAQGYSRVATLVPNSPYGSEVNDAFRDEAQKLGLTVAKSAFYNPQNVDLSASVRDLVGGKPISGTVPFEAVFAPTPPNALPLVTSQLAYFDVDKAGIQLLGTGLWQNNEVLKPGANGARGAVFAAPTRTPEIDRTYAETYGVAPQAGSPAILGVDLAYVLGEAAAELRVNGQPVATTLNRPEGFYAPGGYVRFGDNHSERGLDVVRVGADGFTVLQPALPQAPLPLPEVLTPRGGRPGLKLF